MRRRRRRGISVMPRGATLARVYTGLGAAFGGVAVILLIVSAVVAFRTWSWAQDAERVQGTVISLNEHVSTDDDGDEHVTYRPEIEYAVAGETHQVEVNWGSSSPDYEVGESVTVLYDPADTGDGTIDSLGRYLGVFITAPLSLPFGIVGFPFLVIGLGQVRHRRALRRGGAEAYGEVSAVRAARKGVRFNGRRPLEVVASWTHPVTGVDYSASERHYNPTARVGDRIRVHFDPVDPADAVLDWGSVTTPDFEIPPFPEMPDDSRRSPHSPDS